MAGSTDLHDTAVEILAACQALLATTAGGPVARAFVSPGDPALDCCPQLTVHVAGIGEAATATTTVLDGGNRHRTGRTTLATLQVTFTRCAPVIGGKTLPSGDDLQATSAHTNEDAWMLWTQLYRMQRDGDLFGLCDAVFFDGITPLAIQGGCAGWVMQIRIELPGFQVEGS